MIPIFPHLHCLPGRSGSADPEVDFRFSYFLGIISDGSTKQPPSLCHSDDSQLSAVYQKRLLLPAPGAGFLSGHQDQLRLPLDGGAGRHRVVASRVAVGVAVADVVVRSVSLELGSSL